MPSVKDQETCEAIALEYTSNGRDKAQGMRTIGYAESSCKSGKAVGCVYGNVRVKAAIARIDKKTAKVLDLSRKGQHEKLERALKIAEDGKNPSAMASVIREQNEMLGYHRDKAPNTERQAQIRDRMEQEEYEYRQVFTVSRCKQLARPATGLTPAPVPEHAVEAISVQLQDKTPTEPTQEPTGD